MSDEIVDLKEVLERVQEDHELLLELLEIFLDDCPKKAEMLKAAVKDKNAEQIKNLAHGMKGASANIAAKKLNASFVAIEREAKENKLTDIPALLVRIDGQLAELRDFYKKLSVEFKMQDG